MASLAGFDGFEAVVVVVVVVVPVDVDLELVSESSSPPHAARISKNMPNKIGIANFRSVFIELPPQCLGRIFRARFFVAAPGPRASSIVLNQLTLFSPELRTGPILVPGP